MLACDTIACGFEAPRLNLQDRLGNRLEHVNQKSRNMCRPRGSVQGRCKSEHPTRAARWDASRGAIRLLHLGCVIVESTQRPFTGTEHRLRIVPKLFIGTGREKQRHARVNLASERCFPILGILHVVPPIRALCSTPLWRPEARCKTFSSC